MNDKRLKIVIILNSVSRKRRYFDEKILPALTEKYPIEVWPTTRPGHAWQLGINAAEARYDVVLSAGGDGTLHQVINGVMEKSQVQPPIVGLIPLGSGNDFARTLGIDSDANGLLSLLAKNQPKSMDLFRVTAVADDGSKTGRYCVNECSMGMGPEVVRRVNAGSRGIGTDLMYTKAIITTFFSSRPSAIEVKARDFSWSGRSRVFVVANGKSFGHAIYIAPNASVNDGVLNTFIASNPSLPRFLMLLQLLKKPREVKDKCIIYNRAKEISVSAPRPEPVEADGEPLGFSPMDCKVVPNAVRFLY